MIRFVLVNFVAARKFGSQSLQEIAETYLLAQGFVRRLWSSKNTNQKHKRQRSELIKLRHYYYSLMVVTSVWWEVLIIILHVNDNGHTAHAFPCIL